MPLADNTRFLLEATRRRGAEARIRAEKAVTEAAAGRDRVTVAGIARAASVSRSWLYTQADLIDAIALLQQRHSADNRNGRQSASDASLRNRLEAANHRNKQLRSHIAELTEQLETAYGEIRALRNAQPRR
ncbi:DUF6262 family protein [Nocardia africana]|uniref:Transposase n=1 Tax=Nocardia africana TaxID=134964 RepID=A0A378X1K1_9NOCA|nr:DUF6262 family protein [Nocardia africana]SUA47319.1 Uncharacterised protein [Nocardia africana]